MNSSVINAVQDTNNYVECSENCTEHIGLKVLRGQNVELLNYKQVANTFNTFPWVFLGFPVSISKC